MNHILISDPFLYPPSGEDIFRGPHLPKNILEYSQKQFKQAWEVASSEFQTTVESFKLWPSVISSPTISSTSEDLEEFFNQMDSHDNSWLDQSCSLIGEEDFCLPSAESTSYNLDGNFNDPSVPVSPSDLFSCLQELDPETIEDVFKDKDKEMKPPTQPQTCTKHEQNQWTQQSFLETLDVNSQIQIQQVLLQSSDNRMEMVNPSDVNPSWPAEDTEIQEAPTLVVEPSLSRRRRKSQQIARPFDLAFQILSDEEPSCSTVAVTDIKPDIKGVLSTVNGKSRKRVHASNNEQSSSSGTKKKRKYEIDDPEDTSVKNAKAAKLNRDRKKQEFAEMKETLGTIAKENKELKDQVAALTAAHAETDKKYQQEREKNLISNGLGGQVTNAKTILELIIPPLVNNLGPMSVTVSEAFANIPVRTDEHGNVLFAEAPTHTDDPSVAGVDPLAIPSTYTTFHISPQERNIKVDYNPHFHG